MVHIGLEMIHLALEMVHMGLEMVHVCPRNGASETSDGTYGV